MVLTRRQSAQKEAERQNSNGVSSENASPDHASPTGQATLPQLNLKTSQQAPALVHRETYPLVAQQPFVEHHYRPMIGCWKYCARSVFELHNETFNIHTHLWPAIAFILGLLFLLHSEWREESTMFKATMACFMLGAATCFSCSTVYHIFGAISHATYVRLLAIDKLGALIFVVCSFMPPLNLGFRCFPGLRDAYMLAIAFLGSSVTMAFWLPIHRAVVVFLGASLALSGVIPLAHIRLLSVECSQSFRDDVDDGIFGVIRMYVLYAIAIFFFLSHLPERFKPGRFDLFAHSHQWWHIFITLAAIQHYLTCIQMWKAAKQHGCCTGMMSSPYAPMWAKDPLVLDLPSL